MNSLQSFIAILVSIGFVSNLYGYEKVIWEQALDYVAIENVKTLIKPSVEVEDISKAQLLTALTTLKFEPKSTTGVFSSLLSSEEVKPLFSDKEAQVLAENIVTTLQTLDENQVLVFLVSDSRSAFFGIGDETLYTSGTIYLAGQHLYLLVAEAQVDIQKKYIRAGNSVSNLRFASAAELRGFKLSTGDYESSPNHDWQLQLSDGITRVSQRPDWIKIDLAEYAKQSTKMNIAEVHTEAPTRDADIKNNKSTLIFSAPVTRRVNQENKSDIEIRLENLKKLYLQGQIPEHIYLQKVKDIVEDI
ncbi:MAG: hypothetical protein CL578_01945 [Alteromonadaceae bacterium]|jgi:hypothetical protein|uniref:Uncharacterized protein n=1 Tax=Paraglaciecola agarilytica NO2 TaxID=1125747 RepID=A0ABQ0IEP0_9ALTE|nr:hypothetical protein [Paraglaciecola agarilytica]MBN23794.1 hypothetical protein [Alteromonadaceae bacterium]GAC07819.1 hypothetical protein GAGA_4996 [Paraglaciecola agarilytica NO2]|tara:strand:- start:14939 stop:15847 length:909 start_codon:yes stop_codon:yes gene_type:complete